MWSHEGPPQQTESQACLMCSYEGTPQRAGSHALDLTSKYRTSLKLQRRSTLSECLLIGFCKSAGNSRMIPCIVPCLSGPQLLPEDPRLLVCKLHLLLVKSLHVVVAAGSLFFLAAKTTNRQLLQQPLVRFGVYRGSLLDIVFLLVKDIGPVFISRQVEKRTPPLRLHLLVTTGLEHGNHCCLMTRFVHLACDVRCPTWTRNDRILLAANDSHDLLAISQIGRCAMSPPYSILSYQRFTP